MKIEILMLKENNERGVRMMFLSLEQLQKLKLNPTRADYEIAYETVGDIIQIDVKELFFCDSVGFKKISFAGTGELVLKAGKENSEKGK